ncbi:MAG TPA: HAMP domain-containing histidine kinase, partial [Desulfobacterales bacterium]|nr:HAMP domain-containing histidine kinase [Desulfobacterales bacterium]
FARMPGIKKTVQEVRPMLAELVALYQQAHPDLEFRLACEPVAPFAFDLPQIKRVVVNLLDNAVAVLGQGGRVEVRCLREEEEAVIVVEDNGPGVPESERQRLFDPYYSTKKSGTGLGLAIASTIVADHGGTITMENRTPHGARFVVRLPFEMPDAADAPASSRGGHEETDPDY